ncbi:MAG: hypothetical protein NUK63_07865 [Candidatus Bathyarchaeum tardum]|nr:MAG: hypothetical protein NUK63_07865 [Candidatus Bathyarchaeum tardum]
MGEQIIKDQKIGIGILATVFGIIFVLIGIVLVLWELMWSINVESGSSGILKYTPHLFEYAYQFLGLILIFLGIIFLIFGIYHWQIKNRKKNEKI